MAPWSSRARRRSSGRTASSSSPVIWVSGRSTTCEVVLGDHGTPGRRPARWENKGATHARRLGGVQGRRPDQRAGRVVGAQNPGRSGRRGDEDREPGGG